MFRKREGERRKREGVLFRKRVRVLFRKREGRKKSREREFCF